MKSFQKNSQTFSGMTLPNLRLLGEISTISDMTLMEESKEELKSLLMRVKEES